MNNARTAQTEKREFQYMVACLMALASNAPLLGLCAKISTVVLCGNDVKRVEFAGIRSSILRYAT